jgi:hypothetical protein
LKVVVPKTFSVVNTNLDSDNLSKIFDDLLYTKVETESIVLEIRASRIDYLVLFGLRADNVRVTTPQHEKDIPTSTFSKVGNWLDYFSLEKEYKNSVVIELPVILTPTNIKIEITGVSNVILSKVIVGKASKIGITIDKPSIDLIDFSTFDRESGAVEKSYISKDMKFLEKIENKSLDKSMKIIESIAGVLTLFIVFKDMSTYMTLGVIRNLSMMYQDAKYTTVDIKIEGVV